MFGKIIFFFRYLAIADFHGIHMLESVYLERILLAITGNIGVPGGVVVNTVEVSARVTAIDPRAELQNGVVNYVVRLAFRSEDAAHVLRPEMTAHVGLRVAQRVDVLALPRLADRSVVAAPQKPFQLLPGAIVNLFISTAVWVTASVDSVPDKAVPAKTAPGQESRTACRTNPRHPAARRWRIPPKVRAIRASRVAAVAPQAPKRGMSARLRATFVAAVPPKVTVVSGVVVNAAPLIAGTSRLLGPRPRLPLPNRTWILPNSPKSRRQSRILGR